MKKGIRGLRKRLVDRILSKIPPSIVAEHAHLYYADPFADKLTEQLVQILNALETMRAKPKEAAAGWTNAGKDWHAQHALAAVQDGEQNACCRGTCCIGNLTAADCQALNGTPKSVPWADGVCNA